MDRREEDFEIPWPSFVDILSAVIIMFIFFILVIVIIMSIMTVKKQVDMQAQSEAQMSEALEEVISSSEFKSESSPVVQKMAEMIELLQQELKEAKKENSSHDSEESQDVKSRTQMKEAQRQVVEEFGDQDDLIIYYNRGEVTLADEAKSFIADYIAQGSDKIITLNVADNPDALTEAQGREQSLARALNLRNLLLENNIPAANIKFVYVPARERSGGSEWVELKVE